MKKTISFLVVILILAISASFALAISNPWTSGHYKSDTLTKSQYGIFDTLKVYSVIDFYGCDAVFEGSIRDDYETTLTSEEPTTDNSIVLPDYGGGVPVVVKQGYTQFSHSEATTVDVTGAALTLADGWFVEGKTFRVKAGGTVTGTNGVVTAALYLEDGAVCSLTTGSAAEGDWTAEFTIIATGDATQRIIGTLVAGAGADPVSDYAADTTDITSAGTIPLKLQVGLANADDTITCEYFSIEHFSLSD